MVGNGSFQHLCNAVLIVSADDIVGGSLYLVPCIAYSDLYISLFKHRQVVEIVAECNYLVKAVSLAEISHSVSF